MRAAVPIDAVVSEYLQLRNAGGGNLKGLCPFHDEKTPSFQVSPSKGLYYCFGCQEGGDTVDFIMKIDHLSFAETIERLASQSGITLRYEEGGYTPGRQQGERTRLVEAHKAAAQFYVEQLERPEAEIGRTFLAQRGFDQAAAQHFGVGYSPAGWDHLVRYLRGRGFTDKELIVSGLAQEGRRGPIDRFRGRLMWPIRDIAGEVVGFGARKLRDDDNGPKYLNTPRLRSTASPRSSTASTSPRRTSPSPAARWWSRAIRTSWPAISRASPPPSPPAAPHSAATTSRSSDGC
ncbi:hypothetical protein SVIO_040280 [Streptomyces violaceusniger]|uniref:Zinc finger CHC2-type domain-containing protein n=1 Tax=Streptomyces violaceusniger TaxID=68280 RepID=A0A4D4KWR6_STRVO|nr:hypothetical protein SVIO_040280 [Streptomyces violaceusniger]